MKEDRGTISKINLIKEEVKSSNIKKNNLKKEIKVSKKENKQKLSIKRIKQMQKVMCLLVAIIFVVLLIIAIKNYIFIPGTMIALALELFCICYYYIDNEDKKPLVYTFFGVGVALIIFEVIYIIIKTR